MTIADKIYEKLKAASPEIAREVIDFLEFIEAKAKTDSAPAKPEQSWDEFMGCLKDSNAFAGDPVEIQRQMRDEWVQSERVARKQNADGTS